MAGFSGGFVLHLAHRLYGEFRLRDEVSRLAMGSHTVSRPMLFHYLTDRLERDAMVATRSSSACGANTITLLPFVIVSKLAIGRWRSSEITSAARLTILNAQFRHSSR